jgi:hypothetical protein
LDIAIREKVKGFTPETAEVLRKWQDPALLATVQGTPVNCLVITWASGLPSDADQQQALKPLLEKGKQAGLGFVGLVEGEANKAAALAAAQSAGLSAVAMEGAPPPGAGIPVIPWGKSTQMSWRASSPVLAVSDGVWPGVPQERTPTGGPTNLPWVDSNGALLHIARALAPGKAIWVAFEPPQDGKLTGDPYMLAVADTATYGGRWVISLDDQVRGGLAAQNSTALDTWKKATGAVTFFEQHKELRDYQPMAVLAVISDFAGADRDLGEEALNLLPRLRQPFRTIARSQAAGVSFAGLRAIFYVDQEPADAKLRAKLLAFVQGGGMLFATSKWPNPEGTLVPPEPHLTFNVRALGKGRLAVAKDDQPDPYDTVQDIQVLMSHRQDVLRLYNGSSMNCFYEASAQERQGVVHLLNYSRRPGGGGALLYMKEPYRTARFVSPEIASAVDLKWVAQEAGGAELSMPQISVYGVAELEK